MVLDVPPPVLPGLRNHLYGLPPSAHQSGAAAGTCATGYEDGLGDGDRARGGDEILGLLAGTVDFQAARLTVHEGWSKG